VAPRLVASRRRAALAVAALVGPALLVPCLPVAALAQHQATAATVPDPIRLAREEAARDRGLVERQLQRAMQYRDLEASAVRQAEQATNPAERGSWLVSSQEHARSAQRLEEHSRELLARADAAEARASRLEAESTRR
jgi:hypothetical protein